ncbi:MAG: MBL fold metallo-hydrolase [Synergistaceae bacterium]|jgi:competence protein ComEC|nr:MBL fold metallo-hydrolase [Synergistaceae bacterium]
MKKRELKIFIYVALFLAASILSLVELPQLFSDGLSFYAFDVGQGDAFLFHFPDGSNVLIDSGTRKSAGKLVSKLRGLGVRKIDLVVATHPHADHIGGMKDVISAFDIGKVWDSGYNHGSPVQKETLEAIRNKKIRFGRPKPGFVEKIGDAGIEVLAPKRPLSGTDSDPNNNSLVVRVTYGEISFLMTGDIEEAGRASAGPFPKTTVLKASHHGSANGTDDKLMREVRPEIAILTYGKGNQYGHPHKIVLQLLEKYGARVYATVDGDITITTDGKKLDVSQRGKR